MPWPLKVLPTSPSVLQWRSGEVAEVLAYVEQVAASVPRWGCAGEGTVVTSTADDESMRPDYELLKQWYFHLK